MLASRVTLEARSAVDLYFRLVLVVGPSGSGKTRAIQHVGAEHGWPVLNFSLMLSEELLQIPARRRALRAARLSHDIVSRYDAPQVLIDNIELLFHPSLEQDPLRLLQSLARNRSIVATWRGEYLGSSLTYAAPDHPEFRRFQDPDARIVSSERLPDASGPPSVQEHSV